MAGQYNFVLSVSPNLSERKDMVLSELSWTHVMLHIFDYHVTGVASQSLEDSGDCVDEKSRENS